MNKINTLWLETLCCIARLGTFQSAAEHMNTTQPAISARIKELEDAVGVALFSKQGRRMVLTVPGRELVQRSAPLLQGLENLMTAFGSFEAAEGVVRLGIGEVVALSWMPALIEQLERVMPRISFEISVGMTVDMQRDLDDGKIDIAMGASTAGYHGIHHASLGSVDLIWVMSAELARQAAAAQCNTLPDLLAKYPIWSLSKSASIYHLITTTFHTLGINRRKLHIYGSLEGIIKVVLSGSGISLLPDILVQKHIEEGRIIAIAPPGDAPKLEFIIAWAEGEEQAIIKKIVETSQAVSTFNRYPAA